MSHKKYINVSIKGMHCPSCEMLIEEQLKDVDNVKSASIDYKTGFATIYYDGEKPNNHNINKAILDAGYEVGIQDKLPLVTKDKHEYSNLGIAFLVLMVLYLVFRGFGLTNINLMPNLSSPSFGLIIVIGLVAGFSTCMALVGGLLLGISTKFIKNNPQATPKEKFRPHLFFVLGRILSYAFFGAILGSLGAIFKLSSTVNGIITLLVGGVMLLMGLQLINIFPRLSRFKISLPKEISQAFGVNQKQGEYSHTNSMLIGALTFFLPCGFTQAMQLYAMSTGSLFSGALVMGLFAIGTAPGLLSVGGVTSLVHGNFKERFFKVAGLAVIFFGLFNLNNGYTLASLNINGLNNSNKGIESVVNDPNVSLENGVQVVRMVEGNRGYSPNSFSIKKGVPVKWIIDAQAPYSCASSIVVPQLGIENNLKPGENIIEFTPTEIGKLSFSCSMGMYTGVFNVYDDSVSLDVGNSENTNSASNNKVVASASGSGTCGSAGGGCGCGGGGGGAQTAQDTIETKPQITDDTQVIKSTYTESDFLSPNLFKVKVGQKVKFLVEVKDNGSGCGYAMMIPGLYNKAIPLIAGNTIAMEFTPQKAGEFDITCSMNMIRYGTIIVE